MILFMILFTFFLVVLVPILNYIFRSSERIGKYIFILSIMIAIVYMFFFINYTVNGDEEVKRLRKTAEALENINDIVLKVRYTFISSKKGDDSELIIGNNYPAFVKLDEDSIDLVAKESKYIRTHSGNSTIVDIDYVPTEVPFHLNKKYKDINDSISIGVYYKVDELVEQSKVESLSLDIELIINKESVERKSAFIKNESEYDMWLYKYQESNKSI